MPWLTDHFHQSPISIFDMQIGTIEIDMLKQFIKKTLLTLTIISLVFAVIFLIEYFIVATERDSGAFFGFLVIAAIFGIPYLIFFRLSTTKNKRNNKQTFLSKKCQSCSSSQFKPYNEGYKCEHCGATYHYK